MDKIALNLFRDGNDLIVVFKNCNKSVDEVISLLSSSIASEVPSIEDIPPLKPVEEPEIVKPEIPEMKNDIVEEPVTNIPEQSATSDAAQEQDVNIDAEVPASIDIPNDDITVEPEENSAAIDISKVPKTFRGESFTTEELEALAKGERVAVKRVSQKGPYTGFVKFVDGKLQFAFH